MKKKHADMGVIIPVKGRYSVSVVDSSGNTVDKKHLCFDNLITDLGLDNLFNFSPNNVAIYVAVGSGSTAPTTSDGQLESQVAITNNDRNTNNTIDTENNIVRYRTSWAFPEGAAAGNLSEIGVTRQSNGTQLFSRALIKDAQGDPTTITVLSNEILIVTYEIALQQPTTDFQSNGVDGYDVTIRASRVNALENFGWSSHSFDTVNKTIARGVSADADLVAITETVNVFSSGRPISNTAGSYTNGTHTATVTYFWGLADANFTWRTGAFFIGPTYFNFKLNPAIEKDNTVEVSITFSVTWARA